MQGQTIVCCPQCGGNKVKSMAIGSSQFQMLIGVLLCITVVLIPFGIFFIIGSIRTKKSKIRLKFMCQECKHDFKVKEEVYDEYDHYIKASS